MKEIKEKTIMATRMGFFLQSIGYSGVSAGQIDLAFEVDGTHKAYRWRGAGCSSLLGACMSRPPGLYIPPHPILHNFQGQDVRLKLGGGRVLWGPIDIQFTICYSGGNRAQVYDIAPNHPDHKLAVETVGPLPTEFNISPGRFTLLSNLETDTALLYARVFGH